MVNYRDSDSISRNYTKLPNEILDQIVLGALTALEIRLVLVLFKQFMIIKQKPFAWTIDKICNEIGYKINSKQNVIEALKRLIDKGLLYRAMSGRKYMYSFYPVERVGKPPTTQVGEPPTIREVNHLPILHKVPTLLWLKGFLGREFHGSNNTLIILYNNISLIKPLVDAIESRISNKGKQYELLRQFSLIQDRFGAEILLLGCLKFSEVEFLDQIHAPPKYFEFINQYIQENHASLDAEFKAMVMSYSNKLSLIHEKVLDQLKKGLYEIDFSDREKELIAEIDYTPEQFVTSVSSVWDTKFYFHQAMQVQYKNKLKELLNVGYSISGRKLNETV